ncbi:MAG TPA: DUF4389 domain-containing protein [Actinomycetota bacterium]|nr:DUF4389 domain-containing protein [Actinomycetota bacterium]
MSSVATYPVHVEARLDPGLSRWLWLVKWFLAIPHYVVLAFLWIAFVVLSVVAFFAILFTGRYPRAIFDFNVGVLRWSWRVSYYTFGAAGTDRYPPFTLREVPDYPADLRIDYPNRLSRGLVLVKWWLLAIPHYLIVGLFVGGGAVVAYRSGEWVWAAGPGLLGLLVLIALIGLAVTGRYLQSLFDLVLGLNRWALRVAGYAGLMTDEYPPFRLDLGGSEPAGTLTVPKPPAPAGEPALPPAPGGRSGWTGARVTAVVIGALLALASLGLFAGGGVALWADLALRDGAGYVTSDAAAFSTETYALTSGDIALQAAPADVSVLRRVVGTVRVRVTPDDPAAEVFVGIARSADVAGYLAGVSRAEIVDVPRGEARVTDGDAVPAPPAAQSFWAARSQGTGIRALTWASEAGRWTVVVMNADASAGLAIEADVGATAPGLLWIALGALGAGLIVAIAAVFLLAVPIRRAGRVRP